MTTTPQFDESKHKRDAGGRFAEKGPTAESEVSLDGFVPQGVRPADVGWPTEASSVQPADVVRAASRAEFDHVMRIGTDSIGDADGSYAPTVTDYDGKLDLGGGEDQGWQAMSGFTGQYGYRGPVMHPSEQFGGAMARKLIDEADGRDVEFAMVAVTDGDFDYEDADEDDYDGPSDDVVGWAVVWRPVDRPGAQDASQAGTGPASSYDESTGVETWTDDQGRLHNDDGPAWEHDRGAFAYYQHGELHRDPNEGPASAGHTGVDAYGGYDGRGSAYSGDVVYAQHGKPFRKHGPAIRHDDGKMEFYRSPGERDPRDFDRRMARRRDDDRIVITPDSMKGIGHRLEAESRVVDVHPDWDDLRREQAVTDSMQGANVQFALRHGLTNRERTALERDLLSQAIRAYEGGPEHREERVGGHAYVAVAMTGGERADPDDYERNVYAALELRRASTPAELSKIANTRGWANNPQVRSDLHDLREKRADTVAAFDRLMSK